jgi:hypothetical protein
MINNSCVWNTISWIFGVVVFAIGVLNIFWGNDLGFGVFVLFLSFVYFPPITSLLKVKFGFSIHYALKILLGIFIIWGALGVGELFAKIDLMLMNF